MNNTIHAMPIDPLPAESLAELEGRVRSRLNHPIGNFGLRAVGRGVVLYGYARTFYAEQLARHAVMEATRLTIVANEIAVS